MLDPKVKVNRRIVRPGLRLRHYGGGDIRSDGQVPFSADQSMGGKLLQDLPAPAANNDAARKKYVDDAVAAAVGTLGSKATCRMSRTTTQNIGAGGGVVIFQVEDFDHGGMVDIAGQPTRITIPQDGTYLFFYNMATNVTSCGFGLRKNGAGGDFINHQHNHLASTGGFAGAHGCGVFAPIDLVAGDYIQISATSNNGTGAVDVGPMSVSLCIFGAVLIASNAVGGGDLRSNGTVPMTADFDNAGFQSKNLPAPVADNDAARKKYVDDAIAALAASVAAAPYRKVFAKKTNGPITVPAAYTDIAGLTTGNFTVKAGGSDCELKFSAVYNFNHVSSLSIRFDIDGGAVTYDFDPVGLSVGAGSDNVGALPVTIIVPHTLAAGVHVVKIRHKANANATLIASALSPASVVADYQ